MKPYLYIANVSEDEIENMGNLYSELKELATKEKVEVIPICAKVESELTEMEDEESKLFMSELGIKTSGIDRFIDSGYKLLEQITFFNT